MIKKLIYLILLGSFVTVNATEYYIATDGDNDEIGSEAYPWQTLVYALTDTARSPVTAGDSIIVRGGTYIEGGIKPLVGGTAADPIVIKNYEGEVVILNFSYFHFDTTATAHFILDSLQVRSSSESGIWVGLIQASMPDDWFTATNCTFSNHKKQGVMIAGPSVVAPVLSQGGMTFRNCKMDSNGTQVYNPNFGNGIVAWGDSLLITVQLCSLRFNRKKGFSFGGLMVTDSSIIDSNYFYDSFESGIDWYGTNSFIRNNHLAYNGTRDTEESLKHGDKNLALDQVTYGNVVAYNLIHSGGGRELAPRGHDNYYYNNTLVRDYYRDFDPGDESHTILNFGNTGDDNVYKNNLIVNMLLEEGHQYLWYLPFPHNYVWQDWDYNCYWAPGSSEEYLDRPFWCVYAPYGVRYVFEGIQALPNYQGYGYAPMDSASMYADPLFVEYTNNETNDDDFTLQEDSPCIDAGTEDSLWQTLETAGCVVMAGSAPDIGAFESDYGGELPDIELLVDSIAYSNTLETKTSKISLRILNIGDADLTITDMYTIFPDTFITQWSFWAVADTVISPGDTIVVQTAFTPPAIVTYKDTLYIINDDEEVIVPLEGTGVIAGLPPVQVFVPIILAN